MGNQNQEVEILDIEENLNPDNIEVNMEMVIEDQALNGDDLVQDTFNMDTIDEIMGEGSVVENVHTI